MGSPVPPGYGIPQGAPLTAASANPAAMLQAPQFSAQAPLVNPNFPAAPVPAPTPVPDAAPAPTVFVPPVTAQVVQGPIPGYDPTTGAYTPPAPAANVTPAGQPYVPPAPPAPVAAAPVAAAPFDMSQLGAFIQQAIAQGVAAAVSQFPMGNVAPVTQYARPEPIPEWSLNELLHRLASRAQWHHEVEARAAFNAVNKYFPADGA